MIETLKDLERQIEESRKRIEQLKSEKENMETTRADIGFSEYEGEKDYLQLQIEKEEASMNEIINKYEELKPQEIRMYEENIEESRKRIQQLKEQIQEMETTRADIGFSEYEGEKDYLQLQIEKEEAKIKEAMAQIAGFSNEVSNTDENDELENNTTEIEESRKRIEQLKEQIQEMETTRADIGFSEYEGEKDYLQLQIEKEEAKIKELTEKQSANINENMDLESLKLELEKINEEMEKSVSRMQEIFTEERKKKEDGPYTDEELAAIDTEYMDKKVAEGEIFTATKNKKEQLEKLIAIKEQELQEIENNKSEQAKDIVVYNDIEDKLPASEIEPYNKLKTTPEKYGNIKRNVDKKIKAVRNNTGVQNRKGEPVPQDMIGAEKTVPLLPKPNEIPLLPEPEEKPLLPEPQENNNEIEKTQEDQKTAEPTSIYGILQKIRADVITSENQDIFHTRNTNIYKRSQLVVSKQFKEELHSGNYLYNIVHTIPTIAKTAFGFVSKISGKLLKLKDTDELMKKLKKNAHKLTLEEKEKLFQEYKGSNLLSYKQPAAVDMVIQEVVSQYALGKVECLNRKIEKSYTNIINAIRTKEANENKLKNENLTEKQREALIKANENCDLIAAQNIDFITCERKEANDILSSGLHGFSEDLKAKASKMNFVGKRFSIESFDPELDDKLAELEEKYKNPETSPSEKLAAFKEFELLHVKHTIIEKSWAGERSVGEKYYSPLAEQLNYNPDNFVRDIFTSVALITSATALVNGVSTHEIEAKHVLEQQNAEAISANEHNTEAIAYANEAGEKIVNGQDTMMDGFIAQSYQSNATMAGIIERTVLDKNVWLTRSGQYTIDDAAGHIFYNETFIDTQNNINSIANDYAAGAIDQSTAIELLGDVATNSQTTLGNVVEECLPFLEEYAANHSFDLTAFKETMNYITQNPNAISDMNQLFIDISEYGEGLAGLTAEQVTVLESLPSDLRSTIIGAASSAALAINVSKQMNENVKNQKYGNKVITEMNKLNEENQKEETTAAEMVDELYEEKQEENENTNERSI